MRSGAARRPSTACPSPGRRSSTCTTSIAAAALFATHYHELTALAARLPGVANATIEVRSGTTISSSCTRCGLAPPTAPMASRSPGWLGSRVPSSIARAEVLAVLEKTDHKAAVDGATLDELPLFAAARPKGYTGARSEPSSLDRAIDAINPDELAPKARARDALPAESLDAQHRKD